MGLKRQPSPRFDGQWYLETYDDVRETEENPLVHYLLFGQAEGREIRAIPNEL